MTVLIKKIGGSIAVVIPRAIAREMELTEGSAVDLRADAGAIILRKHGRRPRRPLSQILAQINPASYRRRRRELADGSPVGREVW